MSLTRTPAQESGLEQEEAARDFAFHAGLGLAGLGPDDLSAGNLTVLFALSAWLRMSGVGLLRARSSLLELRRSLLEVSGLEKASEPVPLLAGDARTALISLAVYMHGLIRRAATQAQQDTAAVVEGALELLS